MSSSFVFTAVQHLAQDAYIAKLKLKHEQERQMQMLKQGKKVELDSNVSLPGGDKALQVRASARVFANTRTNASDNCLHMSVLICLCGGCCACAATSDVDKNRT